MYYSSWLKERTDIPVLIELRTGFRDYINRQGKCTQPVQTLTLK
jgi:hypothetical protein